MSKLLNISEAFSIAMHSMVLIAQQSTLVTIQEIAGITGASRNHIAKVLQTLTKHRLLKSYRGPNGGFILAKLPADISLMEIYQITDGTLQTYSCEMHKNGCQHGFCVFGGYQEKFASEFTEYLKSNSLKDIIKNNVS